MDIYFKTIGGAMVALVLLMSLSRIGKDYHLLLGALACCMIFGITAAFLSPVIDYFHDLEALIPLDQDLLGIVVKTTGIGMIGQVACAICDDCGSGSLGKALQFLTGITILWMSLPLFQILLDMLKEILEGL